MTSSWWPSEGHLLEDHEKVIYCRTLSMTFTGGTSGGEKSTGHLLVNHQQDRTSTSGSSAGQETYWMTISRTSTGRSSAGYLLKDYQHDLLKGHKQDIYLRIISRTSTWRPSAGHSLTDHQQDMYLKTIRMTSTLGHLLEDHQLDRTPTGWPSAGHLLENHQQDIFWKTIIRTSTVGSSAWHSWEDHQLDWTPTGRPSAWHLLEDHQQDRASTGRPSAGHFLEYHQKDIYWRIITMTSTSRSSWGNLQYNHRQNIYCRTISRTSTGRGPDIMKINRTGHLLDEDQTSWKSTEQDIYWKRTRHHENQQDRTSTDGPSVGRTISRTSTGRPWEGCLLVDHQQDSYGRPWNTICILFYWRTISRTLSWWPSTEHV